MHIPITLSDLLTELQVIGQCLIALGRLYWLHCLCEPRMAQKRHGARVAARMVDEAWRIDDFQHRHYQVKTSIVRWPVVLKRHVNEVLANGNVVGTELSTLIARLGQHVRHETDNLMGRLEGVAHFEPAYDLLREIKPLFASFQPLRDRDFSDLTTEDSGIFRSLQGPKSVDIDPVFARDYSLLEKTTPPFDGTLPNSVQYFWALALREAAASNWCALSGFEYDGLPIEFYRDMAKQAWDEARHAVLFLDVALKLFPTLQTELPSHDPLQKVIQLYYTTGTGLPVPLEGSLYEALWNAELPERLILLQIDTEGKAVATSKGRQQLQLSQEIPFLMEALRVDQRDEISHASYGHKWLRFLIRDSFERAKVIETTRLLRGVLLLTCFSHQHNRPLDALVTEYSSGKRFPCTRGTVHAYPSWSGATEKTDDGSMG
jgi:hypothetical protein